MVEIKAYAKINLFLDIESRREDGYHNIKSIMQSVDWYDVIRISENKDNPLIKIESNNKSVPTDESNIVYKVAKAFLSKCNICSGVNIYIEKNIPISAGMAGGSTDGAATLKAMNKLFGEPFSLNEMIDLTKPIGADIPFSLVGGTKIIKGIGDIIEGCHNIPQCYFVCAKDNSASVSTPKAYKDLDVKYNDFKTYITSFKYEKIIEAIKNSSVNDICDNIFNLFEEVIEPCEKSVILIKDILKKNGAMGAMMSGSGPSVFGVFDNLDAANLVANKLIKAGINAKACSPIFEI